MFVKLHSATPPFVLTTGWWQALLTQSNEARREEEVGTYTKADEAKAASEGHGGGAAQAVHQVGPQGPPHCQQGL